MSEPQPAAVDYSLTHRVTRTSSGAPNPFRIFFHVLGRSLEFAPADSAEKGTPQDVCAAVAKVIAGDPGLAPHFKVEPIPTAKSPEGGRAAEAAAEEVVVVPATEGAAASRSSRSRRSKPSE